MGSLRSIRTQISKEPALIQRPLTSPPEPGEPPYVGMSRAEEITIVVLLAFHLIAAVGVISFVVYSAIKAWVL
jgi:hypothetical protein